MANSCTSNVVISCEKYNGTGKQAQEVGRLQQWCPFGTKREADLAYHVSWFAYCLLRLVAGVPCLSTTTQPTLGYLDLCAAFQNMFIRSMASGLTRSRAAWTWSLGRIPRGVLHGTVLDQTRTLAPGRRRHRHGTICTKSIREAAQERGIWRFQSQSSEWEWAPCRIHFSFVSHSFQRMDLFWA